MSCTKVHQGKVGACVHCERDEARAQLATLREKVVEICCELEWYTSRKIDLAKHAPVTGETWAEIMLSEIGELRTATRES